MFFTKEKNKCTSYCECWCLYVQQSLLWVFFVFVSECEQQTFLFTSTYMQYWLSILQWIVEYSCLWRWSSFLGIYHSAVSYQFLITLPCFWAKTRFACSFLITWFNDELAEVYVHKDETSNFTDHREQSRRWQVKWTPLIILLQWDLSVGGMC